MKISFVHFDGVLDKNLIMYIYYVNYMCLFIISAIYVFANTLKQIWNNEQWR